MLFENQPCQHTEITHFLVYFVITHFSDANKINFLPQMHNLMVNLLKLTESIGSQ